jgi:hypothetical protein
MGRHLFQDLELEVLRDSVKSQVREMRDAVEHLDNDILDGRLPETATVEFISVGRRHR